MKATGEQDSTVLTYWKATRPKMVKHLRKVGKLKEAVEYFEEEEMRELEAVMPSVRGQNRGMALRMAKEIAESRTWKLPREKEVPRLPAGRFPFPQP